MALVRLLLAISSLSSGHAKRDAGDIAMHLMEEAQALEADHGRSFVADATKRTDDFVSKAMGAEDWRTLSPDLKTGDLILFSSQGSLFSTTGVIKTFTWSDWTHCALVSVMKFDAETFEWRVVAEQGPNTVLALAEVANHPVEDFVTGDKYHGFQEVRLIDKVSHMAEGKEEQIETIMHSPGDRLDSHADIYDYASVAFFPLKKALDQDDIQKLQAIYACLHMVRTRYEKGTNLMNLMLMPLGMNSDQDLSQMFCSDFVAYIAFEMGWLNPEEIGYSVSKNLSPGDLLKSISLAAWDGDGVRVLDVPSAQRSLLREGIGDADQFAEFPTDASQYWLKRNAQYEQELLKCRAGELTYMETKFPNAHQRFVNTYWGELHTQRLWAGVGVYTAGNGAKLDRYFRLVATVDDAGQHMAAFYYGKAEDAWKPNSALSMKRLKMNAPGGFTWKRESASSKFSFTISDEDRSFGSSDPGVRHFEITDEGTEDALHHEGGSFAAFIDRLREWANPSYRLTADELQRPDRTIFVFSEAAKAIADQANMKWWKFKFGGTAIVHVPPVAHPEPLAQRAQEEAIVASRGFAEFVQQAEELSRAMNGPSRIGALFLQHLWGASEGGDASTRVDRAINLLLAHLERNEVPEAAEESGASHDD
jgi:hypothetical protein